MRKFRWWYYLLAPFALPLGLIVMVLTIGVVIPFAFFVHILCDLLGCEEPSWVNAFFC